MASAESLVKLLASLARTDAYCDFNIDAGHGYRTRKSTLAQDVVIRHAAGRQPIAVYPVVGDQTRIAVLDFDNHENAFTFEEMAAQVLPVFHDVIASGLVPTAFRSGGGAGIHIWLIWKEWQSARSARRLLAKILSRHGLRPGARGLHAKEVEIYPKQDAVEVDGVGSAIALPLARLSVPLDHMLVPVTNQTQWRWRTDSIFSPNLAEEVDESGRSKKKLPPSSDDVSTLNEVLEGDLAEVTSALRHLPADDYASWVQVGFVLKHSFGENGFVVWDTWSQTAAEKYPGILEIKRVWTGLKPRGELGLGSLFHMARERGWNGPTSPVIREMNARFGILTYANKTMIIVKNGDRHIDEDFLWLSKPSFIDRLAAEKIIEAGKKPASKARIWLDHPAAVHYHRVDFDPSRPPGHNGKTWNIWSGFGVEAIPGDWSLLQDHILNNICGGRQELFDWLLNWMALGVQKPGKPIGTAPVLQGLPGTGKGFLAQAYGRLWGGHYISVTHKSHVSGRFNAHLFGKGFVFIDEGTFGGNRQEAGLIKTRVTDPYLILEIKGVDPIKIRNRMNFMVASNEDSIVPADLADRRWQVFQVGDRNREDHAYFAAIAEQLANGGYEAMLYDLQHRDLSKGPDPRKIIRTAALFEQIIRATSPETRYLHQILDNGFLPQRDAWGNAHNATTIKAMHEEMLKGHAGARFVAPNAFGRWLQSIISGIRTFQNGHYLKGWRGDVQETERSTLYVFPPLNACRKAFEVHIGQRVPWSNDLEDWIRDDDPL